MAADINQEACYVRYVHPSGFRSGQWAKAGPLVHRNVNGKLRCVLQVTFVDGQSDYWPIFDDAPGTYQFSNVVTA